MSMRTPELESNKRGHKIHGTFLQNSQWSSNQSLCLQRPSKSYTGVTSWPSSLISLWLLGPKNHGLWEIRELWLVHIVWRRTLLGPKKTRWSWTSSVQGVSIGPCIGLLARGVSLRLRKLDRSKFGKSGSCGGNVLEMFNERCRVWKADVHQIALTNAKPKSKCRKPLFAG